MQNILKELKEVLKNDKKGKDGKSRFIKDDELNKNQIIEFSLKNDKDLIRLLLSNEITKKHFFTQIDDITIFEKDKLNSFVSNKAFLKDSYTAFGNKIGLALGDELLKPKKEVVLSFPFKDCILEGGQEKEDEKRSEIMWNITLAPDEINRLLEPKVLTNFKKFDKNGEHKVTEIKDTDNLIIRGNNLLVLHSLLKRFSGRIKLIYIDPPYNTGSDSFNYNDSFNHSTWLTFMKNRLEVAKELLKDDGIIFIQIDSNELGYLIILMDEIFENKKQSIVSIKVKSPSGDSSKTDKLLDDVTEYILVYSRSEKIKNFKPYVIKEIVDKNSKTANQYRYITNSKGMIKDKSFNFYVGQGRNKTLIEVYKVEGLEYERKQKNDLSKEFFVENFENVCRTAKFSGKFLEIFRNKKNEVYYFKYTPTRGKNAGKEVEKYVIKGEELIYLKNYSRIIEDENKNKVVAKLETASNFIYDIPWQGIAKEGNVTLGKGKKPAELLKRIIKWSTKSKDLILDFVSGTGTTCAVSHKMGRQYIGVEQLDYGKNDSIVRLKNVINGDQSGISKSVNWKGGGSFLYCELAKWNQLYIEKTQNANSKDEVSSIWKEMQDKAFFSYRLDFNKFEANIKEFEELSFENQKRFLFDVLDKNHLYVNYSEIDDEEYKISEEDKKLNKLFYKG